MCITYALLQGDTSELINVSDQQQLNLRVFRREKITFLGKTRLRERNRLLGTGMKIGIGYHSLLELGNHHYGHHYKQEQLRLWLQGRSEAVFPPL